MDTLIEIAALLAGLTVFIVVAVISLVSGPDRSGAPRNERFVPGNYHPHHGGFGDDDWSGHHG